MKKSDELDIVIMDKEEYDEMVVDQEMDAVAASILFEFSKGLREDSCTCVDCIVEEMAAPHGGIQ